MVAVRVLLALREREKLYTVIQVHDRVVLVLVLGLRNHAYLYKTRGALVCALHSKCRVQESAPLVAFGGVRYFSIFLRKIRSKKRDYEARLERCVQYAQQQQQHRSLVAIPCTPNAIQERSEHLIVGKQEEEGCVISSSYQMFFNWK